MIIIVLACVISAAISVVGAILAGDYKAGALKGVYPDTVNYKGALLVFITFGILAAVFLILAIYGLVR